MGSDKYMRKGGMVKSMEAGDADMAAINAIALEPLDKGDVYTFEVVACDNDIDRDFERFDEKALGQLAKLFVGKTVIKEWIAEELPAGMKCYRSPKSYNSQLGVPLSVLMIEGDEELALIEQKMSQLGTKNREAYLRKMALDGYVVRLELPELREMVSLLRRSSNNLNQLTRRVHETGRIYDADLEDLRQGQEKLWEAAEHILSALAALK